MIIKKSPKISKKKFLQQLGIPKYKPSQNMFSNAFSSVPFDNGTAKDN